MGHLLTIAELAARTSTCEAFWRKKIALGEVPVIRIGRSVRVDEEIVKLIIQCGVQGRSKPMAVEGP